MPLGKKETKDTDRSHTLPHSLAQRVRECEIKLQHKIEELDLFKRKREVLIKTIEKIQFIKRDNPPTDEELKGYGNYEQRLIKLIHQIAYDGLSESHEVK